jgi:glycosyltransferase involved in cell wall biosynthesis
LFPYSKGSIIAISQAAKDALPHAMQKKTSVIYNGVHIPESMARTRPSGNRPIRFLYLGRIVPWKGCLQLIDIFNQVTKRFPLGQATLALVGGTLYWSKDYREELENFIRVNNVSENCVLVPHTENPYEVFPLYDVFCSASYKEPFGRAIAEAQAVGMPVVAFDGGGVGEIVEHGQTGLLAPYGDMGAFARAMETFIEQPERIRTMGAKGRERIKKFFNREVQIPLIVDRILETANIPVKECVY